MQIFERYRIPYLSPYHRNTDQVAENTDQVADRYIIFIKNFESHVRDSLMVKVEASFSGPILLARVRTPQLPFFCRHLRLILLKEKFE